MLLRKKGRPSVFTGGRPVADRLTRRLFRRGPFKELVGVDRLLLEADWTGKETSLRYFEAL